MEATECVSCGAQGVALSTDRGFCDGCAEHFAAGERHQVEVAERASRLDAATKAGDAEQVSAIMRDIFDEHARMTIASEPVVVRPKSSATVRKGK